MFQAQHCSMSMPSSLYLDLPKSVILCSVRSVGLAGGKSRVIPSLLINSVPSLFVFYYFIIYLPFLPSVWLFSGLGSPAWSGLNCGQGQRTEWLAVDCDLGSTKWLGVDCALGSTEFGVDCDLGLTKWFCVDCGLESTEWLDVDCVLVPMEWCGLVFMEWLGVYCGLGIMKWLGVDCGLGSTEWLFVDCGLGSMEWLFVDCGLGSMGGLGVDCGLESKEWLGVDWYTYICDVTSFYRWKFSPM